MGSEVMKTRKKKKKQRSKKKTPFIFVYIVTTSLFPTKAFYSRKLNYNHPSRE